MKTLRSCHNETQGLDRDEWRRAVSTVVVHFEEEQRQHRDQLRQRRHNTGIQGHDGDDHVCEECNRSFRT